MDPTRTRENRICEKMQERDIVAVVCGGKTSKRKSETETNTTDTNSERVFISVVGTETQDQGKSCSNLIKQERIESSGSLFGAARNNDKTSPVHHKSLSVTKPEKQSPSKSPNYVRKPMPINEPKPILPKSKQLDIEQALPEKIETHPIQNRRRHLDKENKSKLDAKLPGKSNQDIIEMKEINETVTDSAKIRSKSPSPLSPNPHTKSRPSTLMLDKREKFKRWSGGKRVLSPQGHVLTDSASMEATPSTDSSKSSKTFEFIDYDEETKAKILEDALKVEEEFLEFVKTLDIEPPDPIIEAGKEESVNNKRRNRSSSNSQHRSGSYTRENRSLLPGSRGQENLDSLCRMMEEIAVLKDQNIKLTEKLHYMEVY